VAKRRLGRGIDALIQAQESETVPEETSRDLITVPLSSLEPNPDQPRKDFDPEAIHELADSIRSRGILQPILVEQIEEGRYRIVAGERRYRASLEVGIEAVPVLVRSFTVEERLEIALIENIQRRDLNPLEEARAIRLLIESADINQEEAARRLGMKRSSVANVLRLLRLPEQVSRALVSQEISAGHARALLAIKDNAGLTRAGELVIQHGLSVRLTESLATRVSTGESPDMAFAALEYGASTGAQQDPDEEQGGSDLRRDLDPRNSSKKGAKTKTGTTGFRAREAEITDIEQRLIELFGTKVTLKGSLEKGSIEIAYLSMDDLDRVVEILLPDTQ